MFMQVRKIDTGCQRRQDRWFRSYKCFEEIKEREKIRRLGGEISTWSVFEAEVRSDQCWAWVQNGDLKRETESLIVAAQNQSIRTNLVKAKIDKSQGDSSCRVCRKLDENIDHIVGGYSKLALKEYKRRHDNL